MDTFLFVSGIIVGIIIVFIKVRQKCCTNFLLKNSVALEKLKHLNIRYNCFCRVGNYNETHTYDNKNFYDIISCKDYLIYQLQFKKIDVMNALEDTEYNRKIYVSYYKELSQIKIFGQYKTDKKILCKKYLLRLEEKLFNQKSLCPHTTLTIDVTLFCSNINNRVYDKKSQRFNANEIYEMIQGIEDKRNGRYLRSDIWNAICRVERGRVSNKMRFSIYKRDGYRCRICGSTKNLEVDHIKPIAKGGKSTYDNLQTLCHSCNKKKGATY